MVRAHGAELIDVELSILHAGARLDVKERSRRLKALRQPDNDCADREDDEHNRKADDEIERTFQEAVERILERLFAQRDEAEPVVLEMRHGVAQPFLEVAYD